MLHRIQKDERDEGGIKSKRPTLTKNSVASLRERKGLDIASLRRASKALLSKGLARTRAYIFASKLGQRRIGRSRESRRERTLRYVHRYEHLVRLAS